MGVSIWEGNKAERVATALEIMAIGNASGAIPGWAAYRNLVRGGLGPKAAPVGTIMKTEKETSMTATMGIHTGITAVSVTEETFLSKEGLVGTGVHEFVYDGGAWIYNEVPVNLTEYGLTVTGTPANGDEIIVTEAYDIINWVVADYGFVVNGKYVPASKVTNSTDKSHPAAALIMEHVIYNRAFDAGEALFAAPSGGYAAGAYKFTVKNHAWASGENDKVYYFTLANAIAENGQGVLDATYSATLQNTTMKIYSGPTSTEVIETVTLSTTEIAGATDLGNTDGTGLNHLHRALFGSSNYSESAARRWINSGATANNWFAESNKFDRPVSYTNVAGLLHGMDQDFLNAVKAVDVECKTNNTFELPGWTLDTAYTVHDKFFLASRDELGYGVESVAEGGVWELYNGAANVDKIKYDLSAQSTARYWWHRSPLPGNASNVRSTSTDGSRNNYGAYNGYGAVAACIIW